MRRIDLAQADQKLIDIINRICHLEVDWFENGVPISDESLQEFAENVEILLDISEDRRDLFNLARSLSSFAVMLRLNNHIPELPLIDDNKVAILQKNMSHVFADLKRFLSENSKASHAISSVVLDNFDIFRKSEKLLLESVGFSQSSIAVIDERTKKFRWQVAINIHKENKISKTRINRAFRAMRNQCKKNLRSKRIEIHQHATTFFAMKDKVAGLSMLLGDTIPLLYESDLDFAAYISGITGATASTLLPSRSK